jgi:hypothetical protein
MPYEGCSGFIPIRRTHRKEWITPQRRTSTMAQRRSYSPISLEEHLQQLVNYYNHERYHESLDNLTPADVYYGRGHEILEQRERIKINTLSMRRKMHYDKQTKLLTQMG